MPTVVVFGLGGTIAMTATADGGAAPALSAEQIVSAVPGLADTGITVEVEDFRRLPGASLTFDDLAALGVLADDIHAARRVRKTHSTSGATFQSPNGGPLGYVVEGRPRLLNRLAQRTLVPPATRAARVALVTVVFDDDPATVERVA